MTTSFGLDEGTAARRALRARLGLCLAILLGAAVSCGRGGGKAPASTAAGGGYEPAPSPNALTPPAVNPRPAVVEPADPASTRPPMENPGGVNGDRPPRE